MKKTVRLSLEFPREHYQYLKQLCDKKGQSVEDFVSNLLIKEIEKDDKKRLYEPKPEERK